MKCRVVTYLVFGLLAVFYWTSCIKEREIASTSSPPYLLPLVSQSGGLPIDLSEFDFLNSAGSFVGTKGISNNGLTVQFADSLLDWSRASQTSSPEGKVYTQVPFRGDLFNIKGSLSENPLTLRDSIVTVKCFYIIFEDCMNNLTQKYLVTLIPTIQQLRRSPGYDFLHKPNFSGVILYSSPDGEYLNTQFYRNGLITNGYLLDQACDSVKKRYIGFYSLADISTKTQVVDDTLHWVYVSAQGINRPVVLPDIGFQYDDIQEHVTEIAPKPPGGGGPALPPDNSVTLTVTQVGCVFGTRSEQYEKGSEVVLQADSPDDDCIFLCWLDGDLFHSNRPSISVVLDKSRTFTCRYVSITDTLCYKLAKLATNTELFAQLEEIRRQTIRDQREYSVAERSNGSYLRGQGEKGYIKVSFEPNMQYKNRLHTHPSSNIFTSAADLLTLRSMLKNNIIHGLQDFIYGTLTDSKILGLTLYDPAKFLNYFDKITMDEKNLGEEFKKKYKDLFITPLSSLGEDASYTLYTSLMDEMGIQVFIGNLFTEGGEQKYNWKGLKMENNAIRINQCFK